MIASYYLVPEASIQQLASSMSLPATVGRSGVDGYYLLSVLNYFCESGVLDFTDSDFGDLAIDLGAETDSTIYIFSSDEAGDALRKLAGITPPIDEMRQYFEDFNDVTDATSGASMKNALSDFIDKLCLVDEGNLFILAIG